MSMSELLESTITEPAPPFPSIDGLIARERRRSRVRRGGAAVGAAAVVAAALLAAQSLVGTDRVQPAASPTQTTAEDRYARFSRVLLTKLATLAPDAVITTHGPEQGNTFTDGRFVPFTGDAAEAILSFTTPTGGALLEVLVVTPARPGSRPTGVGFERVYSGCAMIDDIGGHHLEPEQYDCSSVSRPDGSTLVYGWREYNRWRYHFAVVVYPSGAAVTVSAESARPQGPALSVDDVVALATDPGFVVDP